MPDTWREAKELIIAHRSQLALGGVLMLISRLVGLVLPASSKYIIDEVVVKGRSELLLPVALAAGVATLLQAISSFLLSQVLGIAAQRAITEMRKNIQSYVERLPVRYFDSTQTGILISRIMHDAEAVRNLIGAGLVQLAGSIITATISIGVLFYLNWRLTALTFIITLAFSGCLYYAFRILHPIFRERAEIYSQVMGRLAQSLSGIRTVKAYAAEKREELVFARGVHSLLRNTNKTTIGVSAISASSSIIIGAISVVMIIVGGNSVVSGRMTLGDLFMYIFFTGLMTMPLMELVGAGSQFTEAFASLDRIREIMNMSTEDAEDSSKEPDDEMRGEVVFENVWFEYNSGEPVLRDISFKAPAGSTTALVGSTGSGKSTLASLGHEFQLPPVRQGND